MHKIFIIDDDESKMDCLESVIDALMVEHNLFCIDGFDGKLSELTRKVAQFYSEEEQLRDWTKLQQLVPIAKDLILSAVEDDGIVLIDFQFTESFWEDVAKAINLEMVSEIEEFEETFNYYHKLLGLTGPFELTATILTLLQLRGVRTIRFSTASGAADPRADAALRGNEWIRNLDSGNPDDPRIIASKINGLIDDWERSKVAYIRLIKVSMNDGEWTFFQTTPINGKKMPHGPQDHNGSEWSAAAISEWRSDFIASVDRFRASLRLQEHFEYPVSNEPKDFWPLRFLYGRYKNRVHRSFLIASGFKITNVDSNTDLFGSDRYLKVTLDHAGSVIYSFVALAQKGFRLISIFEGEHFLRMTLKGVGGNGTAEENCEELNGSFKNYRKEHETDPNGGSGLSVRAMETFREATVSAKAISCNGCVNIVIEIPEEKF